MHSPRLETDAVGRRLDAYDEKALEEGRDVVVERGGQPLRRGWPAAESGRPEPQRLFPERVGGFDLCDERLPRGIERPDRLRHPRGVAERRADRKVGAAAAVDDVNRGRLSRRTRL